MSEILEQIDASDESNYFMFRPLKVRVFESIRSSDFLLCIDVSESLTFTVELSKERFETFKRNWTMIEKEAKKK